MELKIIQHSFLDSTNEKVEYERLALCGTLNGEYLQLELKLSKAELQLAKALMAIPQTENLLEEE